MTRADDELPRTRVERRSLRTWLWVLPALALAYAGWLVWTRTVSTERIHVRFERVDGVRPEDTALLWRGLRRSGVYVARPGWAALLARIVLANAVMAGLLIWMGGDLEGWLAAAPVERVGRLALCIVVAAAAYFAALFLFGTRLRHVRNVAGA